MAYREQVMPGYSPGAPAANYDSSPDCSKIQQYARTIVEFMKLIQKDNPNQFISQNDVLEPKTVSPNKSYFVDPDGGFRIFGKATPLKKDDYPFLKLVDTYLSTSTTEQAMEILTEFKKFKTEVASRKRLAAVLNKFENSSGQPYVIEDFRQIKTQLGYTDYPLGGHNHKNTTGDNRIIITSDGRRYLKYETFDNLMTGVGRCMQIGGYRRKRSGKRSGKRSSSRKRSSKMRKSKNGRKTRKL